MSFAAKYATSCTFCGGDIAPGEPATYVGKGELGHAAPCEDGPPKSAKVCPGCNLALPATGVCDDCA